MALSQAHVTHVVNKADPDIAKFFPRAIAEPIVIDWHPKDRRIYDVLTGKVKELIETDFEEANVLSLIGVMQMMCDAPSMIDASAANRESYEKELAGFIRANPIENPTGEGRRLL